MKPCLLVIDAQEAFVQEGLYQKDVMVKNIQVLEDVCRQKDVEVIFVCHNTKKFTKQSKGWNVYPAIAPMEGETVIEKWYNSAFKDTELLEYLDERSIDTLIICGLQSEYCIDTTCKVAFEYGLDVYIGKDCTSTFDQKDLTAAQITAFYENNIWKDRFAKVIEMDELLKMLENLQNES